MRDDDGRTPHGSTGSDVETRRASLLARLRDSDPGVRDAAARALDRLDALEGLGTTLEELRGKPREGWVGLLRSLEGIRDETCLRLALKALEHPAADVRLAALDLAADFRDGRASPHVARLLSDPNPVVRARAASALGSLCDRRAGAQLESLLSDPDPQVLAETAGALGLLGHGPAQAALSRLSGHPDPVVRTAAVEALGRLSITRRT